MVVLASKLLQLQYNTSTYGASALQNKSELIVAALHSKCGVIWIWSIHAVMWIESDLTSV